MPSSLGRRERMAELLAAAIACAVATSACSQSVAGGAVAPSGRGVAVSRATSPSHIQHIVILVQENRSFNDFFATFRGVVGATQGLMKTPSGDVVVQLTKGHLISDSLGHQHLAFELEYDHGKMDGFNLVERALRRGERVRAGKYAYRYVDPSEIKPYWQIAQQYVLADHMFMTQTSSSFTAHQDLIAGGTPVKGGSVIDFPTPASWGCDAKPGTVTSLITSKGRYLQGKGPFPCFAYPTLRDLLDRRSVSWLYFTNTSTAYVWNAFDAVKAVRYGPEWTRNIVTPGTAIFQTIAGRRLPAVSWVIPDAVDSDHPGYYSDTGPSWVASIVNAIGESPYWPSTAIIVLWDDWGGAYDNVAPPQLDGQGLGMRVPMLLVSAYARQTSPRQLGYVSHTPYEFGSVVKFIEDNWNLGRLGTTDVRANSIADCLDFTQPPRGFIRITAKYTKAYFERRPPSGLPVDPE
jgi:phospholipase C